jgi:hypothetical protein
MGNNKKGLNGLGFSVFRAELCIVVLRKPQLRKELRITAKPDSQEVRKWFGQNK